MIVYFDNSIKKETKWEISQGVIDKQHLRNGNEKINRIDAESFSGSHTMTKQMASCLGLRCNQHQ